MEFHEIIETQKKIIDTISYGVDDAIIITDPNRQITHFNRAAEKLTDYRIMDVLGQKLENFLDLYNNDGKISADNICPISDIDLEGIIYEGKNLKLKPRSHAEEIVNVRSLKVKGGSQVNLGCLIFIENTFEQSELERMKLDFVSMSEHVLRTPITVIRGYLSRLLDQKTVGKLNENELKYINNAMLGTTELLSLVENLLNIAEFRTGDVKIDTKEFSLEDLITKVVADQRMVADEKGIRVVFIPPVAQIPQVNADISKLKIVIQNLIENAIKYSENGAVNIAIENKGDHVQVSVKDTGRGIPQEFIGQLFTKFYRVKKALEMEYGMGLGLYMSKKIIDAHGGKIWVESVDGVGSTFYFTLPIARPNPNE